MFSRSRASESGSSSGRVWTLTGGFEFVWGFELELELELGLALKGLLVDLVLV